MINNPNAEWENCDYLLWPAWYAYASWAIVALIFAPFAFAIWMGL